MHKQELINEQIELAKKVKHENGSVIIITESRLSKTARKVFYGFRFEKEEKAILGRVINNEDGSFSKIIAKV